MRASNGQGVLPIDKPVGPTSHDMVARARRALRIRRVGHTGTLDPFASGLLLLCLDQATRLAEYLTGLPKTYHATLRLGVATDTDDRLGSATVTTEAWRELDHAGVAAALEAQTGRLLQRPPAYSARKVGGERAYRLARAGVTPQLEPSEIEVYALEITRFELPAVDFTVRCSAGTYIRSIARDVGQVLGVGAHLTELRRTAIGDICVERALSPETLEDESAVLGALIAPLQAVRHLARIDVEEDAADAIRHGRPVAAPSAATGTVALAAQGELLAIAESDGSLIRPRKVFADD